VDESITGQELEFSQHLVNTTSTVVQPPSNVELVKNDQIAREKRDVELKEFIQHTTKEKGERGCVEQSKSDKVLQNKQLVTLPTAQEDTFSQTNSQSPTSQQEAISRKHQPVEVLNSEGEWISGYWVHKCIVVANLEGIERKWALYDELGEKYVFWGQIRLPRFK